MPLDIIGLGEDDSSRQTKNSTEQIESSKRKITKLSAGVKDPNRINIFIDGKFSFSLALAQVVDAGLKVGTILSPEREQELISASEYGKLYQRTLEWVLVRPRSEHELRDYLKRRQIKRQQLNRQREYNAKRIAEQKASGTFVAPKKSKKKPRNNFNNPFDEVSFVGSNDNLFDSNSNSDFGITSDRKWQPSMATKQLPEISDQHCDQVFAEIIERGYVNDLHFAEYFVENRNTKKGISERKLRQELQQKDISQNIINEVLRESGRDETEEIQKIIAKKRSKYDDTKLLQYLVRQGFSYDLAKNAIQDSQEY